MDTTKYLESERKRAYSLYNNKKRTVDFAFKNKEEFSEWFATELQNNNFSCNYCKTSIFDIRKLIENKKLIPRNVGRGGKRGLNLEVERKDSGNGYNPENCTVICYLCNNDKSSIINSEDYLKFMACSRKKYMDYLLNSN